MNTPLQLTFHNVPHSQAVENAVKEAAVRLEAHHDRITSCRVVIDQPHRHHREGNLFEVRIDLKMPGVELVVKRELGGGLVGRNLSRWRHHHDHRDRTHGSQLHDLGRRAS